MDTLIESYDEAALAHRMALVKGFLAAELEHLGEEQTRNTPKNLAKAVELTKAWLTQPWIKASPADAEAVLKRFGWSHTDELWYHPHWGHYNTFRAALAWALLLPEELITLR